MNNKIYPMDDEDILPNRKWLRHETPYHGIDRFPVFFITICCRDRPRNQLANNEMWPFLLETIKKRNGDGQWNCSQFLVMPDHLHGIFSFDWSDEKSRSPMEAVGGQSEGDQLAKRIF